MKKIMTLTLLLLLSVLFFGCGKTTTTTFANPDSQFCDLDSASGTYTCSMRWTAYFKTGIELKVYYRATDQYDVSDLFYEVGDILAHYHQLFDKYNPYTGIENIYTINRDSSLDMEDGTYGAKTVSIDLFSALQAVLLSQRAVAKDGPLLFNAALGPLLQIWHDARESETCGTAGNLISPICARPGAELLALTYPTDPEDILLDPEAQTIRFAVPGMGLDLGGFGKGYVSELIADRLDALDIVYLLNSGNSNIKAGGINPQRETGDFFIALTKPTFTMNTEYFAVLQIPDDLSVVTSGAYQNYFIGEDDNRLYHHIIDPRTKLPGGAAITLLADNLSTVTLTPGDSLMSVTVFCEDGGKGDILSTSLYLMTLQEGQAYVEADPDIEAVWYQWDGTVTVSSGLNRTQIEITEGLYLPLIGPAL